jgi:heat shock protein HslJ
MAQEQQFLDAVGRVTRYVIDDDRLDLRDDQGALQVSFRAQVT